MLFERFETLFFLQNCNFYKNSRITVVFDYNSLFEVIKLTVVFDYNCLFHFYHICINFIIVVDFIYFVLFERFETLFFLQNCNFYKNSRITVVFDYNSLFELFLSLMYSFYYCS